MKIKVSYGNCQVLANGDVIVKCPFSGTRVRNYTHDCKRRPATVEAVKLKRRRKCKEQPK